ncbi:MAG: plasmid mobilization relaxosome protein MobC, partial [Streptococcus sp.]
MSDPKKLYRQIQKIMRVTPEENELINRRMAQHNFSNFNTYARYMLLTGEVVTVDYSELIKLRTEINRIGTNINQLARYVNTNEE